MADIWRAPHGAIKVADASTITIDSSTLLDTEFSTATATTVSGFMKNITISSPEGNVEMVNLLGVDANSFQNALLDEKPFGLAELSGTLVLAGDEILEHNSKHLFFGTATTIATTHSRYQPGKTTTGNFNRPKSSWLVNLDDGTDEVNIVLDNAVITKVGDKKIDSADGHWEMEVTVKCLPKDYYEEIKD